MKEPVSTFPFVNLEVNLISQVRAERDTAVAAASILARAAFLNKLKSLGDDSGVELLKGVASVEFFALVEVYDVHARGDLLEALLAKNRVEIFAQRDKLFG